MRKPIPVILLLCIIFSSILWAYKSNAQQLKLGNHPTQIEKSAVLELESSNQGLLLTRIPDTSVMTSLYPPDGMIIYFTDSISVSEPYGANAGVYERKDGVWQKLSLFFTDDDVPTGPDDISFSRSHDTVTLHLPDATPTIRGVVNGGEQTFGGDKLFNDSLIAEGDFRANNAQVDDSLILSKSLNITDPNEWFLSTDANGKVFLQKVDNVFWKTTGNSLSGTTNTLGTNSNTDLSIITKGIERMHITKEGKIGIYTNSPSDTLTVNGSFKLGQGGSSFSAMARDSFTYTITVNSGYVVPTHFSIPGIKKDAHVIVNPRSALQNGSTIALISWVRSDADGYITVCFYTTGSDDIGPITFDVYYINPK